MRHIFSPKNRALLSELVRTDFKLRYQNSTLGYAWSLLRPMFMFLILYVVFVEVLHIGKGIEHYPIYLFMGIVLWNFFLEMTTQSLTSIVGRGDLIRKIKIPRWIIILSSSISALINLGLNLLVVLVFMVINNVDFLKTSLFLPLLLVEIYIFAIGVSLFLSAAYVKYRDIQYIWEVILQAGFYATPILYPLALIKNVQMQQILLFNPMAQSIQDARYSVITHQTLTLWKVVDGGWHIIVPFVVTALSIIIGVIYFRSQSKYFAENI